MTHQFHWHVLCRASIYTETFHRKSYLIFTLCHLRCLFPSLCVCVSTCSFPLSIKRGINSMDAQMEGGRWHIWLWKWAKWDELICVSLSVFSALIPVVFFSLVLLEKFDLYALCAAVLWLSQGKCCHFLGENWKGGVVWDGGTQSAETRVTRSSLCVWV